jgi:hypothetical protein
LVIRVLSALKMRNFPMIFSKNFVEGHGPLDGVTNPLPS